MPDAVDDEPRSVTWCGYCSNAVVNAYNINSGMAGVDKKCVAVGTIDIGCGRDAATVDTMVDVVCGTDDAGVVDVVDVDCGMEDLLQHSDDNVMPKDQFDRHTVDFCIY